MLFRSCIPPVCPEPMQTETHCLNPAPERLHFLPYFLLSGRWLRTEIFLFLTSIMENNHYIVNGNAPTRKTKIHLFTPKDPVIRPGLFSQSSSTYLWILDAFTYFFVSSPSMTIRVGACITPNLRASSGFFSASTSS